MTEIGEAIMIGLVPDDHDAGTCPFCRSGEPKPRENIVGEAADENDAASLPSTAWQAFHNDSRLLGRRLARARGQGGRQEGTVSVAGQPHAVWTAAHHLIPGKESLQPSGLYANPHLLWEDGTAAGNIGYDVNRPENGEWLPGSYAITGWGEGGIGFVQRMGGDPLAPQRYAWGAIAVLDAQFHDRHLDYSLVVKRGLDRLNRKIEHLRTALCPRAAEADAGARTLPQIVARLDAMSARLRTMLTRPDPETWKTDVYTSRFSLSFMLAGGFGSHSAGSAGDAPPATTA